MIDRSEILAVATDIFLQANVVEKDYVLGWLLAGIYSNDALAETWVFKGGTCLKKCYFETYRFSEDLDFTLTNRAQLDATFLLDAFCAISQWLYNETGLEIPADQLRFDIYQNPRGGLNCEGRVYYIGPLQRRSSLARIKLDLTADEILAQLGVRRAVWHPYSDSPSAGITALCYAYEELFGEKLRAAGGAGASSRSLRCDKSVSSHGVPAQGLGSSQRARSKMRVQIHSASDVRKHRDPSRGNPGRLGKYAGSSIAFTAPFESFWNTLPEFFAWLESGVTPAVLQAPPISADEQVFRPAIGCRRLVGSRTNSLCWRKPPLR